MLLTPEELGSKQTVCPDLVIAEQAGEGPHVPTYRGCLLTESLRVLAHAGDTVDWNQKSGCLMVRGEGARLEGEEEEEGERRRRRMRRKARRKAVAAGDRCLGGGSPRQT